MFTCIDNSTACLAEKEKKEKKKLNELGEKERRDYYRKHITIKCPRCRFNKCLEAGMNHSYVSSE